MCGINGIIYKPNEIKPFDISSQIKDNINAMNNSIIHRGPDDDGVYLDQFVGFGMRRLSIIDLNTGKQPIYNEQKDIVITFNGEIYNFLEIKVELEKGILFRTHSDTEVILKLYELYGKNCVAHLDGMFAFAIHDKKQGIVFIARDRFGEKPLYYSQMEDKIIWASELKSITNLFPTLKRISSDSLNIYMALTYIPAPFTIYENVYKLKAGHYMTINTSNLNIDINKYWDVDINSTHTLKSYEEAKQQVKELLVKSIERRMIADVPLGVFLSGGVDSTIVAATMAKISRNRIKTFSVGFKNKRYDESDRARIVAEHIGSEHHEYILDYNDLLGQIDNIILNYDEPFADASCLPTYFISSQTVKHVKVALTGDGGDEVFGGYNKYLLHSYGEIYKNSLPGFLRNYIIKPLLNTSKIRRKDSRSKLVKIRKMIESIQSDSLTNHLNIIALGFKQSELLKVVNKKYARNYIEILKDKIMFPTSENVDKIKLARYIDKQTSLEGDMLVKVDRASMLCSLECRAPFLDHKLIELTYQIQDDFLIKGNNKKKILKDTFKDLLPAGFFDAPKSGFEIPIADWLRNELKQDLINTLSIENMDMHGFFNTKYVLQLIDEHLNKGIDHSWQIWTLFCFEKWYNKEMKEI